MSGGTTRFRDFPIRWKFSAISMAVTLAVVSIAAGSFLVAEIVAMRKQMAEDASLTAKVTGMNCSAALLFNDRDAAMEILSSMQLRSNVARAVLYDEKGAEFASYIRNGNAARPATAGLLADGARFADGKLHAAKPVIVEGRKIGSVYIEMGLRSFRRGVGNKALIAAAIILLSLPASFLLSMRLQRYFTGPISDLVGAAQRVSEERDYSVRVGAGGKDELGVLISVFNDMLRQIEERDARLLRHAVELEGEVARRTAELRDANEKLTADLAERKIMEEKLVRARTEAEAATQLKDQFVSLVSHDLRSPLASMVGGLSALRDELVGGKLSREQDGIVAPMLSSARGLIHMIDQLLDLSRLKSGKIRPKLRFIHPHYLVADSAEKLANGIASKRIRFINDVPPDTALFADHVLFGEVLLNIISNAVKFTKPGGEIRVCVPEGRPSALAVRDTGVGVPERMIGDLFKHEVKTTTVGTGGETGTGLGLPFCHDIMAVHGGSIGVESKKGEGSVFYLELPMVRTVVLVVDDQEAVRKMVIGHLAEFNLKVVEAENGLEALKILMESEAHLVIADINMPVLDGYELLKRVRSHPSFGDVPFIVMSSMGAEPGVGEKAFALGADDFVVKPIIPDDFIPRVKRFIG